MSVLEVTEHRSRNKASPAATVYKKGNESFMALISPFCYCCFVLRYLFVQFAENQDVLKIKV